MTKAGAKTKSLFKKAHKHNWDNGRSALTKILDDKDCDKATALLIFWRGSPDYYYNHNDPGKFQPYEKEAFKFLQRIEAAVLAGKYPSVISWEPEKELVPRKLGKIPARLAEPVSGVIGYKEILYPNDNPFADQVFALCSNCKSVDKMYALERQGADFSQKILNGYTFPIQVAINYGQVEAVKYFIEKGYDLDKKYDRDPLLFSAVRCENDAMLELLVEHGVKVNQKGLFGRTVLHCIAGMGDFKGGFGRLKARAEYLIANGADVNAVDVDKKTPHDLAVYWKNIPYKTFLEKLR